MKILLILATSLAIGLALPPPPAHRVESHKAAARKERQADANCPIGCPPGWVKWPLSDHCYLMPSHPAHLDTFWNWQAICKSKEPSSYVAVSSNWAEQGTGMAVILQYAPQFLGNLASSYVWLGGYTTPDKWNFLDGSDQTNSIFFLGALGVSWFSGIKNGTCLTASPWGLLGTLWETRDCNNPAGTAICEMAQRSVCGEMGGYYLPIAPVELNFQSMLNFFPKLPEIPYAKQIFSAFGLDNAINWVGSTIKCWFANKCSSDSTQVTQLPNGCRWGCPDGWFSFDHGAYGQCYLFPDFDETARQGRTVAKDTWGNSQLKCTKTEDESNLMVINSLIEMAQIEYILRRFKWNSTNPDAFLWLGESTSNGGWNYVDGSINRGNLIMTMNNLRTQGGSYCLAADLSNGAKWRAVSCDQKAGLSICEMQKKQICSTAIKGGRVFQLLEPVDMSLAHWKQMFPNMPFIPFLDDFLQGKGQLSIDVNNFVASSDMKDGQTTAQVMCVKKSTSWLVNTPDYAYLHDGQYRTTINGRWVRAPCRSGNGPKWAFEVSSSTMVSAWSRCYNKGYETAMPIWMPTDSNTLNWLGNTLQGWYPFMLEEQLAPYYEYSYLWGVTNTPSSGIKANNKC